MCILPLHGGEAHGLLIAAALNVLCFFKNGNQKKDREEWISNHWVRGRAHLVSGVGITMMGVGGKKELDSCLCFSYQNKFQIQCKK